MNLQKGPRRYRNALSRSSTWGKETFRCSFPTSPDESLGRQEVGEPQRGIENERKTTVSATILKLPRSEHEPLYARPTDGEEGDPEQLSGYRWRRRLQHSNKPGFQNAGMKAKMEKGAKDVTLTALRSASAVSCPSSKTRGSRRRRKTGVPLGNLEVERGEICHSFAIPINAAYGSLMPYGD